MDPAGLLHLLATAEPHPPFYYGFLSAWYPLVGTTEFALRFPTVIANVLTIGLLIKVAERFAWRTAGLVGAAILAVNPYQIWYSQEARMYTVVALFGLGAVYCALQALRSGARRYLIGYVGFMALALYTHYYAMFLCVFVNVLIFSGVIFDRRTRLTVTEWIRAQVVVALLFLPWLAFASRIALDYNRAAPGDVNLLGNLRESLVTYSVGTSVPVDQAFPVALGFLAVIFLGLVAIRRGGGDFPAWFHELFATGYLLMPMLIGLLVSLIRPMFLPRYFMVSAPAFYLLLGLGLTSVFRRAWPLGIVLSIGLVATQAYSLDNYFFNPQYDKSEFSKAVTYVEQHTRPGDAIILDGWSQDTQFWYYHLVRAHDPTPGYSLPVAGPDGWQQTPGKIDQIMAGHRGIWLLDYGATRMDPQHRVETYLATHYYQTAYHKIIDNRVVYYAAPPPTAPSFTPLDDSCDGTLLLKGFRDYSTAFRPGEPALFALDWQALKAPAANFVVSWRLLDAENHTVVQQDEEPSAGFSPTTTWSAGEEVWDHHGILIPASLPAGQYLAQIVVYDKATGAVCQFQRDGATLPSGVIPLTRIDVSGAPVLPTRLYPAPSHPAQLTLGGLTLLGYDLTGGPVHPGDTVSARLYWQVTSKMGDVSATARLIDSSGTALPSETVPLGPPAFPTSRWQPGRTVASYVDVKIPPRATSGTYQLSLAFSGRGLRDTTFADFPPVHVIARPRTFTVPPIAHPITANFDGKIGLLGYGMQLRPGASKSDQSRIQLTLYWRDLETMMKSYKVFAHLVGPDGKIAGQQDAIPLAGAAPTDGWIPGEVLTDHYTIDVPRAAPDGTYRIVVGFYDPENGARLPLTGQSGDSLTVTTLRMPREP